MNPAKVVRARVEKLTDLPNVGPAMAHDLNLLGITQPGQLAGQDARDLYDRLCALTATRHDPCVLDVFMSLTGFMAGDAARPWWDYTGARKQRYPKL
jgi:hypothetical protein